MERRKRDNTEIGDRSGAGTNHKRRSNEDFVVTEHRYSPRDFPFDTSLPRLNRNTGNLDNHSLSWWKFGFTSPKQIMVGLVLGPLPELDDIGSTVLLEYPA